MFNVGDRVRLVNWRGTRRPSPDTGTVIAPCSWETSYYIQWDDVRFNREFFNCYWRTSYLEAAILDPLAEEKRLDQQRRHEHAMRYL